MRRESGVGKANSQFPIPNSQFPIMFITLEGPEGSGKTSHIPHLVEYLREQGYTVFPTREPGGTSIGEQIREELHSLKNTEMNPRTETLLYQAARAQFVEEVIKLRLEAGKLEELRARRAALGTAVLEAKQFGLG